MEFRPKISQFFCPGTYLWIKLQEKENAKTYTPAFL